MIDRQPGRSTSCQNHNLRSEFQSIRAGRNYAITERLETVPLRSLERSINMTCFAEASQNKSTTHRRACRSCSPFRWRCKSVPTQPAPANKRAATSTVNRMSETSTVTSGCPLPTKLPTQLADNVEQDGVSTVCFQVSQ